MAEYVLPQRKLGHAVIGNSSSNSYGVSSGMEHLAKPINTHTFSPGEVYADGGSNRPKQEWPSPKPQKPWGVIVVAVLLLWSATAAIQRGRVEPQLGFFGRLAKVLTAQPIASSPVVTTSNANQLPGLQGTAGQDGSDGVDGQDGQNGLNGLPGSDGNDGLQGTAGQDGGDSCISGVCVSRQASSPGVQEAGNLNLSGSGVFGGNLQGVNLTLSGIVTAADGTFTDDLEVQDDLTISAIDCTSFLNGGTLTTDATGLVSCTDDDTGATLGLQGTYDVGNTISTSNNRNIYFNLSDTTQDADFIVDMLGANTIDFRDGGSTFALFDDGGDITFTPVTNGTSTFLVRDNIGNPILNVDSTNQRLGVGTASPSVTLHVAGSALIENRLRLGVQSESQSGAFTLTPTASYVEVDCTNGGGCAVTMGEGSATEGDTLIVANIGTNDISFSDTSGVSELAGGFTAGQFDSITLVYSGEAWLELSRSDN